MDLSKPLAAAGQWLKTSYAEAEAKRQAAIEEFPHNAWPAMDEPRRPLPSMKRVRQVIAQRDPRRWARIQRDYAWMEKQMIRLGLDPEDARYLL